jgi:hypothetical protein
MVGPRAVLTVCSRVEQRDESLAASKAGPKDASKVVHSDALKAEMRGERMVVYLVLQPAETTVETRVVCSAACSAASSAARSVAH